MMGDTERGMGSSERAGIIKGLASEQAYLLVYALLALVVGASFAVELTGWLAFLTIALAFLLAALAIVVVERRRRLSLLQVNSAEQRDRLAPLPDQELAIRGVLDGLVDNDSDTYFVYSSTLVDRFIDYNNTPIDFPFTEEERRVTAIPDAQGISLVHALLDLGQKRERLHVITSRDFRPEYWESNLILIGSRNANLQTEQALKRYKSPFRFNEAVTAIVVEGSSTQEIWPTDPSELKTRDYAVLLKFKRRIRGQERTQMVLAGIGGIGTLAACHYLHANVTELHRMFENSSFGCALTLDRTIGYTSVEPIRPCVQL